MKHLILLATVLVGCVLSSSGCATGVRAAHPAGPAEGLLINPEEVGLQGARNALDLLRRAQVPLDIREYRDGTGRITDRGSPAEPLVVVDGVPTTGLAALTDIPARSIRTIRVLRGAAATRHFGRRAGGGAILIETW
jgi:outer membrane cobalamin receptor